MPKHQSQTESEPQPQSKSKPYRLAPDSSSPCDTRIETFLNGTFADVLAGRRIALPRRSLLLDRPGLARTLSVPANGDHFHSDIVDSYRVKQGILHNPKNDRRTTQGAFHVCEGGLAIPDDKISVSKEVFLNLFLEALKPPADLLRVPFTALDKEPAELFASLLMRPVVCPEVPGFIAQKSMETRFFAPGNLINCLDFVETIFGNAGDPYLAENDAALDVEHWTGHTGCVILAPHLIRLTKKELGLPSHELATARQRRDGACWKRDDEFYNDGKAFKITCRDLSGVIVTLIADNYFGYCKKEVKTQISYAANLFGLAEEEHSGGANTFPSYDLGREFTLEGYLARNKNTFENICSSYGAQIRLMPEGYGIDKNYPTILYVRENAYFNLRKQTVSWTNPDGRAAHIRLLPKNTYVLPSGYKVRVARQAGVGAWRLAGIVAEGTLCHKPCTVSGGGKSEISKSIADAMIQGPVYVPDFPKDVEAVEEVLRNDFSNRFKKHPAGAVDSRPLLSEKRSLGSVIKLLTESNEYTDEYNTWLGTLSPQLKEFVFTVKRFYRTEWSGDWRSHFSVDIVNGRLGNELKFQDQKISGSYLRIGKENDGSWRVYRVRPDFAAAEKIQTADDITASILVGRKLLPGLNARFAHPSVKLIHNCENLLFQRPDDAIIRGQDKQAEADLASPNTFLSNFEPLAASDAEAIAEDAIHFELYTQPMRDLILRFLADGTPKYIVSSAHPRLVDGKPTKNPRYLQRRPDLAHPDKSYLAETGLRFFRQIPSDQPVPMPVNAVLSGRRNNPPDRKSGIPPLAIYNPIHYQELPELFIDYICSVTGKSPSTTGFGSEGALTKGPFNALPAIIDLNNAFLSFVLGGYDGFSSAAGHIGPKYRVDHDISLLVPEIWCRMSAEEQTAAYLIENGFLNKLDDYTLDGKNVRASLLGWRINRRFVRAFLGRIFTAPDVVFNDEMLAPETQDPKVFAEALDNLVATQKTVAENYFADGSVDLACPPLKALLHIMRNSAWEGKDLHHPEVRKLFTRESVITSAWYRARLASRQQADTALWDRHIHSLESFMKGGASNGSEPWRARLELARRERTRVGSDEYLRSLDGTIGRNVF